MRCKENLIELLRAEVESRENELEVLRKSMRYRLGDTLLQALPLSLRSFRVVLGLWRLIRRHGVASSSTAAPPALKLPLGTLDADNLLLGPAPVEGGNGIERWASDNPELMAFRLRIDAPIASLTLNHLSVSVVRQLGRLQQLGCHITWDPAPSVHHPPELVAYVVALADEHRSGELA